MKKVISILLALSLLAGLCTVAALAADEETDSAASHLYFNGAKSGSSVVTSIRKGNSVTLSFTVIDTGVDAVNFVAGSIDGYYASSSLPLQRGEEIDVTPGDTKAGKMSFEVNIPVKYVGTGNSLSFTIFYQSQDKEALETDPNTPVMNHTIDCSYNVAMCKESTTSTSDDDDTTTPVTPYIIVSNYSYGGSSVTAGENFTLELTLHNTSTEYDLDNIIMNITPQGVFSVASSSNTLYLETLPKEGSVTKSIVIKAGMSKVTDEDDANSINLKFSYQYMADLTRHNGESTESITLPVDYPDRFQLGSMEMNGDAYVGEEYYLYLPMVNKGRSSVYNLTAYVEGDMDNPGQSQYIGNLAAGTESGADFNLRFSEAGEHSGTIIVTYEDANMTERTLKQPFTVNAVSWEQMYPVDDPGMSDPTGGDMPEPAPTGIKAYLTPRNYAIAGVVVVLIVVIIIRKKRKAERAVGDEEI